MFLRAAKNISLVIKLKLLNRKTACTQTAFILETVYNNTKYILSYMLYHCYCINRIVKMLKPIAIVTLVQS